MAAVLLAPTPAALAEVARVLLADGIVAVPTETVYGLAASAFSLPAVRKIFAVKGRPLIDPLIVHVSSKTQASQIAAIPPQAKTLMDAYWPGPLTLVLNKNSCVPSIVTAGQSTVGIRAPAHPVLQQLLQIVKKPIAAPSANPFGYVSPTKPEHVQRTLGEQLDYILDGGPCDIGIESTIVDLTRPETPRLLRAGPVTIDDIEAALMVPVQPVPVRLLSEKAVPLAPGMLSKHYSPATSCSLLDARAMREDGCPGKTACVWCQRPSVAVLQASCMDHYWLSEDGCPATVARNLYGLMQRLDQMHYERIYFELMAASGIGYAINDRLRRACHRTENS